MGWGVSVNGMGANRMNRYHVGESMLASMRHFLRFIDLDDTFDKYGFNKKVSVLSQFTG